MKKILPYLGIFLCCFAIIFFIFWMIGWFIGGQADTSKWDQASRFLIIFLTLPLSIIVTFIPAVVHNLKNW